MFTDVIAKKRDGEPLCEADIALFVRGLTDGTLPAEQISALAMAIYLRSMNFAEAALLTSHMAQSGTVLEWHTDLAGPVIDKHSTGGIGDKVSLMLAPIAAACGCFVPMISGRGLGHTGGTLDKLEAIPGYCITPDLAHFREVVKQVGCAIIGQTEDLAPADRRLYAIRDVTATVASVPLITASILSKKLAAGNQGLIMDVKVGNGAFMTSMERARELSRSLIATATEAGLPTQAVISDMNEPLGTTAGNALEVAEAVAYLRNEHRDKRLNEVTVALTARMLLLSGLEAQHTAAVVRVEEAIASGAAAEVFARMVAQLGGPADFMQRPQAYLPQAAVCLPVAPVQEGYLAAIDARAVGMAIIDLGGGRRTAGDRLDLSVGFGDLAPVGTRVGKDKPLGLVHAATAEAAQQACEALRAACTLSTSPPAKQAVSVIREILTGED